MIFSTAGQADVIVVAPDVTSYPRGRVLQDADTIDIADGSRVTVLLSSNAVREIKGPAKLKVADLSAGRPSVASNLWQQVINFLGTGGVSSTPGATRAFNRQDGESAFRSRDGWKGIPLNVGDVVCVAAEQPVTIMRANSSEETDLRVSDIKLEKVAQVTFLRGQFEVPWPKDIPIASGGFIFTIAGLDPNTFKLRVLSSKKLESDRVLEYLAQEGCQSQIKLWLEAAAAK